MASKQQREDERAHFKLFAALLAKVPGELPLRLLSHDDNPDFLASVQDQTIGIEHTELFKRRARSRKRPCKPAELEGIQQGIIRKARESYTSQGHPSVAVRVWFYPGMKHTKLATGRSGKIADELSQFVAEWVRVPHPLDQWPRPGNRIPEISHLSIHEGPSEWVKGNPAWVRPPHVLELQQTIDEKNSKYDVYRKRCDECWLLIAADKFNPAQGYEFTRDDRALRHCYRAKFERVFFLELGDRWLKELSRCD